MVRIGDTSEVIVHNYKTQLQLVLNVLILISLMGQRLIEKYLCFYLAGQG